MADMPAPCAEARPMPQDRAIKAAYLKLEPNTRALIDSQASAVRQRLADKRRAAGVSGSGLTPEQAIELVGALAMWLVENNRMAMMDAKVEAKQ